MTGAQAPPDVIFWPHPYRVGERVLSTGKSLSLFNLFIYLFDVCLGLAVHKSVWLLPWDHQGELAGNAQCYYRVGATLHYIYATCTSYFYTVELVNK